MIVFNLIYLHWGLAVLTSIVACLSIIPGTGMREMKMGHGK